MIVLPPVDISRGRREDTARQYPRAFHAVLCGLCYRPTELVRITCARIPPDKRNFPHAAMRARTGAHTAREREQRHDDVIWNRRGFLRLN